MLKKLQKYIAAINTYYAFAVLLYTAALYAASHSYPFAWLIITITPLLAGWTGYLLKGYFDQKQLRHGFRIVADKMTYEIGRQGKSLLHFHTTLQAATNHLMVYPISYQWTGEGDEAIPEVTGPGQRLLALVRRHGHDSDEVKVAPYDFTSSIQGDWHYWFVALNPPLHRGDITELQYTQAFHDKKGVAKPILYYFVKVPMKRLELSVKFPKEALPQTVKGSIIKASDPRRPRPVAGVQYDPEKQWATWVIKNPKTGACYRIEWQ